VSSQLASQQRNKRKNPSKTQRQTPPMPHLFMKEKKAELELRDFALGISQSTQPAEETPKTQMPHPD
jgi:hypothetical protein